MNTTTGVFGQASGFASPGVTSTTGADHYAAIQRQIQGIYLLGGALAATTSAGVSIVPALAARAAAPVPATLGGGIASGSARTAAQDLVAEIHDRSGLKLEEIARLLGATRRTIQNWRAGGAINSLNERRLRSLRTAIERIDAGSADETRRRLLDRVEGEVSPFDLLAEERFDLAVAVATGKRPAALPTEGLGARPDLAARLSANEDAQPIAAGRPSTRRLRRG